MAVEGAIANDSLILDCSATMHMFTKKDFFESLKPEELVRGYWQYCKSRFTLQRLSYTPRLVIT